jgi:hypothetical protein
MGDSGWVQRTAEFERGEPIVFDPPQGGGTNFGPGIDGASSTAGDHGIRNLIPLLADTDSLVALSRCKAGYVNIEYQRAARLIPEHRVSALDCRATVLVRKGARSNIRLLSCRSPKHRTQEPKLGYVLPHRDRLHLAAWRRHALGRSVKGDPFWKGGVAPTKFFEAICVFLQLPLSSQRGHLAPGWLLAANARQRRLLVHSQTHS